MPAARWRKRLTAALSERLGYKAAALFFAVVLWVAASGDEPTTRAVPVRFAPALDSSVRLLGTAPAMHAVVAGPARELLKLYATPPALRHAFGPETPGAVRLELRTADVDLPTGVRDVVVRAVEPAMVALRFEAFAERRVPVRLALGQVDAPAGLELVPEPDTVIVRGPRERVDRVDAITATLRARLPADSLHAVVALDTAGLGVTARPSRVQIVTRDRHAVPAAAVAPDTPAIGVP